MAQLNVAPGPQRRGLGPNTATWLLAAAALVGAGFSGSCGDAPATNDYFNQVTLLRVGPDGISEDGLVAGAVQAIEGADFEVLAAFEDLETTVIADALISAQSRGVDVKVVGDADHADQAGMVRLLASLRAGDDGDVPVHLGDGPLRYNPTLIDTITRPGDMNRMTHNFLVIDRRRTLNLSGGFLGTSAEQIGFDVLSEDVAKDFEDEFTQLFGGTFATTLDTYNGPLKSNTDNRDHYPMGTADMEIYFGPQERSIKKVIDEVYAARASVFIVTEEFTNGPLVEALRYKAEAGFEVRVAVSSDGVGAERTRIDSLVEYLGTDRVFVGDNIQASAVIIDSQRSPIDGKRHRGRAMILSQPLTSSISYVSRDSGPDPRTSDAFMDSNMWVVNRYPSSGPSVEFDRLTSQVDAIFGRAEAACVSRGCGGLACVNGICVEAGQ